ncbi:hypothetical protein TTHERM_000035703 (macronuclear) [Tetrahymena thermophila SB210]|uniref:Uncharacterized protein n=1 Tax=Tetrahymena thermophila (strain SB210) TaxID=312017 RepID=W7XE93_TETTS|nr:hypothetical protein TTHERM_000035703 [Tetrahymena thermophila SB210]EWS74883.1 hypothetical protein TTHERM_000035703 [Tetrahymena thermophila SB210]|eukprot:XP_012652596.1 hypothetical protein TTHERM_000035703 [Tetrahymena thermophila SB210]
MIISQNINCCVRIVSSSSLVEINRDLSNRGRRAFSIKHYKTKLIEQASVWLSEIVCLTFSSD